ncbi:MAG: glycosyltransferase family 39 protein [bacterium]|nr:glycosyltransferase family 39 protein [bacterium]
MRNGERFFVVTLLIFAAALRILGITFGEPDPLFTPTDTARGTIHENVAVHPDEHLFVARPLRMVVTGQLNPKFFHNPSLLNNLNFFTFLVSDAGRGMSLEGWEGINERRHTPFPLYVISRAYSAFGGLLAVAAVYATARLVGGRGAALAAGLLTAVAFPLVQHAHYSTTSSLAAGFSAAAIWASTAALYHPQKQWMLVAAGAAVGLAAGSRYNAAAVVLFVGAAAGVLMLRQPTRRSILVAVLAMLAVPVLFIATTPWVLFDTEFFLSEFSYIYRQYALGEGMGFTTSSGVLYEYRYLALFGMGIPAFIMVGLGIWVSWRQRKPVVSHNSTWLITLLLLVYLIPYSLVVLNTARPSHSDQLLVPVIPAFALWAGIAIAYVRQFLKRPALHALLVTAVIAIPLSLSVQLVRLLSQTDTRYIMQAWIEQHVPHGTRIHLDGPYNVPLDDAHYRWSQSFAGDLPSLDALIDEGVEYVVVSDSWYHEVQYSDIVAEADKAMIRDHLADYEARLEWVATIERPVWWGRDGFMVTASAWHHPSLILYRVSS